MALERPGLEESSTITFSTDVGGVGGPPPEPTIHPEEGETRTEQQLPRIMLVEQQLDQLNILARKTPEQWVVWRNLTREKDEIMIRCADRTTGCLEGMDALIAREIYQEQIRPLIQAGLYGRALDTLNRMRVDKFNPRQYDSDYWRRREPGLPDMSDPNLGEDEFTRRVSEYETARATYAATLSEQYGARTIYFLDALDTIIDRVHFLQEGTDPSGRQRQTTRGSFNSRGWRWNRDTADRILDETEKNQRIKEVFRLQEQERGILIYSGENFEEIRENVRTLLYTHAPSHVTLQEEGAFLNHMIHGPLEYAVRMGRITEEQSKELKYLAEAMVLLPAAAWFINVGKERDHYIEALGIFCTEYGERYLNLYKEGTVALCFLGLQKADANGVPWEIFRLKGEDREDAIQKIVAEMSNLELRTVDDPDLEQALQTSLYSKFKTARANWEKVPGHQKKAKYTIEDLLLEKHFHFADNEDDVIDGLSEDEIPKLFKPIDWDKRFSKPEGRPETNDEKNEREANLAKAKDQAQERTRKLVDILLSYCIDFGIASDFGGPLVKQGDSKIPLRVLAKREAQATLRQRAELQVPKIRAGLLTLQTQKYISKFEKEGKTPDEVRDEVSANQAKIQNEVDELVERFRMNSTVVLHTLWANKGLRNREDLYPTLGLMEAGEEAEERRRIELRALQKIRRQTNAQDIIEWNTGSAADITKVIFLPEFMVCEEGKFKYRFKVNAKKMNWAAESQLQNMHSMLARDSRPHTMVSNISSEFIDLGDPPVWVAIFKAADEQRIRWTGSISMEQGLPAFAEEPLEMASAMVPEASRAKEGVPKTEQQTFNRNAFRKVAAEVFKRSDLMARGTSYIDRLFDGASMFSRTLIVEAIEEFGAAVDEVLAKERVNIVFDWPTAEGYLYELLVSRKMVNLIGQDKETSFFREYMGVPGTPTVHEKKKGFLGFGSR